MLLKALNKDINDLSEEGKRYIKRIQRKYSTGTLTQNEAFNNVIRQVVLYQEATGQGYFTSIERAQEILKETEEGNLASIQNDKEVLEQYQNIREIENTAAKELGYKDAKEYRDSRIDLAAKSMTINYFVTLLIMR